MHTLLGSERPRRESRKMQGKKMQSTSRHHEARPDQTAGRLETGVLGSSSPRVGFLGYLHLILERLSFNYKSSMM